MPGGTRQLSLLHESTATCRPGCWQGSGAPRLWAVRAGPANRHCIDAQEPGRANCRAAHAQPQPNLAPCSWHCSTMWAVRWRQWPRASRYQPGRLPSALAASTWRPLGTTRVRARSRLVACLQGHGVGWSHHKWGLAGRPAAWGLSLPHQQPQSQPPLCCMAISLRLADAAPRACLIFPPLPPAPRHQALRRGQPGGLLTATSSPQPSDPNPFHAPAFYHPRLPIS